ncbi:rCG57572 [Rattus norvegicus]|uniref:RCG57572 n=1 Tax=Rattus norvegicus TaxID=10116 RepID=A6JHI9_RAT|nr:rCG57572 [Rattus norvegicus]
MFVTPVPGEPHLPLASSSTRHPRGAQTYIYRQNTYTRKK